MGRGFTGFGYETRIARGFGHETRIARGFGYETRIARGFGCETRIAGGFGCETRISLDQSGDADLGDRDGVAQQGVTIRSTFSYHSRRLTDLVVVTGL